jgi:peptidoglycan/LPS O-acetylase OafA/YrhL
MAAALLVIYSHSYVLSGGWEAGSDEFLVRAIGISFGDIAVNIFFIVSGFLVTRSLLYRQSVTSFFKARILRIYPALTVSLLLSAFVVGIAFTKLPVTDYLAQKSVYSFVLRDLFLIDFFHFRYGLPEVFADAPYPNVVNGSLWTLPWEMWAYISLGLAGFLPARFLKYFVVTTAVGLLTANHFVASTGSGGAYFPLATRLGACFYIGGLAFILRSQIRLGWSILSGAAIALLAAHFIGCFRTALILFLCYGGLCLAYLPGGAIRKYNALGDYSYGMYIFAYPIQQSLVVGCNVHSPVLLTCLTIVFTLPLAFLSWHFVEKKALEFKTAPKLGSPALL